MEDSCQGLGKKIEGGGWGWQAGSFLLLGIRPCSLTASSLEVGMGSPKLARLWGTWNVI